MAVFITVTDRQHHGAVVVNVDHIRTLWRSGDGTLISFGLDSEAEPDFFTVTETIAQILDLIESAT